MHLAMHHNLKKVFAARRVNETSLNVKRAINSKDKATEDQEKVFL